MVAMDVVDTLRHEQSIAQRELDSEGRRDRLLSRLRALYAAQGLYVPDSILEEGIQALEQERFQYQAYEVSWRTQLARVWVSRTYWLKPLRYIVFAVLLYFLFHYFTEVMPQQRQQAELPDRIRNAVTNIESLAKNPAVLADAQSTAESARLSLEQRKYDQAGVFANDLEYIEEQLRLSYSVRVISRPNENSGIWRRPPNNPDGKNYYLIVEAIDKNKQVVALQIVNEEDNKVERKKTWGLRVNEETFYQVAADKRDDGIIQSNEVGKKLEGYLEPQFNIPTTGATISRW